MVPLRRRAVAAGSLRLADISGLIYYAAAKVDLVEAPTHYDSDFSGAPLLGRFVASTVSKTRMGGSPAATLAALYVVVNDIATTLEAFSAKLREDTGLHTKYRLVNVIHATMCPAHVSLWLRRYTLGKDRRRA